MLQSYSCWYQLIKRVSNFQSFGQNGANSMSIPDKSFEYLITNTKKALSLYDIGQINTAYKCTGKYELFSFWM
jgi:hypothetical protein